MQNRGIMENWEKITDWILTKEGGYVNDPKDPGGETNFGISKRKFPEIDIKALTKDQAKAIYYRAYWVAFGLGSLPWPFSGVCMDTYVQHRETVAKRMVETSKLDRRALLEARRVFYLRLIDLNPSLGKFKNGWLNRIGDLSKLCDIEEVSTNALL